MNHTIFVLPEIVEGSGHDLTLLVLADGNRRGCPGGGYARGARRIVTIAEHLARRPDVATMIACVLSPENIALRGDGFFRELWREFILLGVAVETRGALVSAGVRVELAGDLELLRARRGHAAALADAALLLVEQTAHVEPPALRLVLGVGYGPDVARALGADVILRTGMEEDNAVRLSGLQAGRRAVICASTKLWPDLSERDVDELLDLAGPRLTPAFADGHGLGAIEQLVLALSALDPAVGARVSITTTAPRAATAAALGRLLGDRAALAVELAGPGGDGTARLGPAGAPHQLRIEHGEAGAHGELLAVLAPGQRPPFFTLPGWLSLGHANVHGCAPTAAGIVEGILHARRFSAAHPPLLGADRIAEVAVDRAAPGEEPGLSGDDALADRFAARLLGWAESAGILLPGAAWRRAALNYALTAFFIHHRVPTEWDPGGALWEDRAELAARYMLLVAAGDEGVFDRVVEGEPHGRRVERLELAARFLAGAVQGDQPSPPRTSDAPLLHVIAAEWRALLGRRTAACHPAAARGFVEGLVRLYAASVAEHRPRPGLELDDRLARSPARIAERARTIATLPGAEAELRVLLYLGETAASVGAGLLFRAAALAAPEAAVTREGIALLGDVAALLDHHFRLANDLSGFLDAPGGDRDAKPNSCSILVPAGAARAPAIIRALSVCQRLEAWMAAELERELDRLSTIWPSMAAIIRRGSDVGRRVYQLGHYTTVSRREMSAIFAEAS